MILPTWFAPARALCCALGATALCSLPSAYSLAQPPASQIPATQTSHSIEECMVRSLAGADDTMTVAELKQACQLTQSLARTESAGDTHAISSTQSEPSLLEKRQMIEELNRANRFLLTPYKRNYILPGSYHRNPNTTPYEGIDNSLSDLNNTEAELQFSIKILLRENIFNDNGHLYLGYTNHAFWQVYSEHDSAPFREINHEPELILGFQNDWEILGFRNALNEFVVNHQSNGQGGLLSRSWNRLMFRSVFERGNYVFSLNPWYRIPEKKQRYPGDPNGDDNPDISDYMGHFEFNAAYKHRDHIFSIMTRNNLSTDNHTFELGWTFPVTANLRGYVRYFEGYGYSLIDYNDRQQVFGLGIIFTDLF